jgi:Ca-activated chloride channel family protein
VILGFSIPFAFKSPWLLLFLLLVPVAIGLYLWLDRRRTDRAGRWSSAHLMPNMQAGQPGGRRWIPATLFAIALTLLLVGFARPEAKFTEAKDGATVVLMVDVSGSMAANDVKPTRLLAADTAIADFVKKVPSRYRIALITFSNHIAVRVPPTYERNSIVNALPKKTQLEGTALGEALSQAVRVAKKAVGPSKPGAPHPPATILLLSDGGQNAGSVTPSKAAADARKAAIPVSTVSLGTASGKVEQKVPFGKKTVPLVTQVPVEPRTLKTVASVAGGHFYEAHSASELGQVYKDMGHHLVYAKKFREVTVIFSLVAFLTILAGAALSVVWFRRLV